MPPNGDSTAGAVLATLIDSEPLTRPELADRTGFSRPTPDWPGPRPSTVEDMFAQSAAGVPAARELVAAEARQLGLTVASACAVFDPELVVLGGGIGSNGSLLPLVRETVQALVPFPPRLETSALGEVASLTGAVCVALGGARDDLSGSLSTGTTAEPERAAG